jgi:hypothetical protein
MQIAVQRQRRPAAEQNRAADLMANRAGAFIEACTDRRCRNDPGAGQAFKFGDECVLAASALKCRLRKSLIVRKSGGSNAAIMMKSLRSRQAFAMRRDEYKPLA